jgi:hypothetical protein
VTKRGYPIVLYASCHTSSGSVSVLHPMGPYVACADSGRALAGPAVLWTVIRWRPGRRAGYWRPPSQR